MSGMKRQYTLEYTAEQIGKLVAEDAKKTYGDDLAFIPASGHVEA